MFSLVFIVGLVIDAVSCPFVLFSVVDDSEVAGPDVRSSGFSFFPE